MAVAGVHNFSGFSLPAVGEYLGENECERVRVIREWVQETAQQRNVSESPGDRNAVSCLQMDQARNGITFSQSGAAAQGSLRRICGRQTLSDLLQKAHLERKGELMVLLEQRPVSCFAHRNRIQALLRGRFLRNETLVPEKKASSVAALELGLLRQRRTVSGLREEFLSKSDTLTSINNSESNSLSGDGNISEVELACKDMASIGNQTASVVEIETAVDGERSNTQSTIKVKDANQVSSRNQQEVSGDVRIFHVGEVCDLNVEVTLQSISLTEEGRELKTESIQCCRHQEVSSENCECGGVIDRLEHSGSLGCSEQLNELQTSAAGTKKDTSEQSTDQWLYSTSDNCTAEQDFEEEIGSWMSTPSWEIGESSRPSQSFHLPSEGSHRYEEVKELFGRKRVSSLLHSSFGESLDRILRAHLGRQGCVSSDLQLSDPSSSLNDDRVVIDELRIDLDRLQEKMNDIQNVLEDCLDMQIELQRSIQPVVSSTGTDESLQYTNDQDSNWDLLKRGICCLCRHSSINSLLYRCGHMCTCLKCAEELVRSTGKCPMCRFPVLDTFQANSY